MRGRRLAAGLIILLLGVMFLLGNMGLMDWSVWGLLFRYWPVLLVLAGVSVLLGGSFRWFVALVLVLVMVAGTVGMPWLAGWTDGPLTKAVFTGGTPPEALTALVTVVGLDVANITTIAPGGEAYRLELSYRNALQPQRTFTVDAEGTGRLTLRQQGHRPSSVGIRQSLEMGFISGIPLELSIKAGVLTANLDLSPYQLRRLDVDCGVGTFYVRLGHPEGTMVGSINSGVGTVNLAVPSGVSVRITGDFGVGVRNLSAAGLKRSGGAWQDDRYDTAESRIDLHVSGGVGRLAVQRY
ncbi:MAG: DUF5668 domain-containing protein [Bacillota bacterium]|nr:DUF5668 domain-containing protein [Bacillota bacterium]